MQFYECHVCGEEFGSDYVGGRQTPKYCPDCKTFPKTGMAVVYGLRVRGGPIRYVGSTKNPVRRLISLRSPGSYVDKQPELAAWVEKVGVDSLRFSILRVVPAERARKEEQKELDERMHEDLLNERHAATGGVYTEKEIKEILDGALQR